MRQQRGQLLAVVDLIIGGYRAGGRLSTTMHCIQGLISAPGISKSTLCLQDRRVLDSLRFLRYVVRRKVCAGRSC